MSARERWALDERIALLETRVLALLWMNALTSVAVALLAWMVLP